MLIFFLKHVFIYYDDDDDDDLSVHMISRVCDVYGFLLRKFENTKVLHLHMMHI